MQCAVIRMAGIQDAATILEIYKPYEVGSAITFECEVPTIATYERRIKDL